MITDSHDYERFLSEIAETAPSVLKMRLPINEKIYDIDLNTRKISAPSFLGVTGDHSAEFIFFRMDRFYEMMDLADTIGVVLFKNANGEGYYQIIPYYDIYSEKNKIIFPWMVQAPAVISDGIVSFSFKFFKIDPTAQKLVYELNTEIARTRVLVGWAKADKAISQENYYTLTPDSILIDNELLNKLNLILSTGRYEQIYWIDLNASAPEEIDNTMSNNHLLDVALPHIHGNYRNGNFYDDEDNIIAGVTRLLYVDNNTKKMYYYNGSNFIELDPEQ